MLGEQKITYEEELKKLHREGGKWKDSELLLTGPLVHSIILLFLINHPKADMNELTSSELRDWAEENPDRCVKAREMFSRTTSVNTLIKQWKDVDHGVEVQMSFYETHSKWPNLIMTAYIKIEDDVFSEKYTSSLD